ncbi:imidazoleglycerol-phosphate dehydratase HisB [Pseudothermotoga thermarum]|uniref:Imidazoleglycerol-phosphate dehydratase n=1 Tax=Pseudothermotoga thermarum DSM 5069 TaxID=688269 RepID=F7YYR8_9THEM|nr:imidazoleglycerol-phosphate dehydratase HisB [Pseudothermotoga thermarum]AEH51106.1 imidazoleglycerol-phosphate dehydratase [Pseudothermotoga thermarum DSM 5069]
MRQAELSRKTKETDIYVKLNIDGFGQSNISTTIGFLDHMLDLFCFHGNFDLTIKASGDTNVDEHHLVEDVGITLGKAFFEAMGDRLGIKRYSHIVLPMDEALVLVAIDLTTRTYLNFDVKFSGQFLGTMNVQNILEFFRAFVENAKMTLHVKMFAGMNDHHICEAVFKATGKVLKDALSIVGEKPSSTKGVL